MSLDLLNVRERRDTSGEDYNLLVIALDLNMHAWGKRSLEKNQMSASPSTPTTGGVNRTLISLPKFIHQVLVFIKAYLTSDGRNRVAIVASGHQSSEFIYPRPPRAINSGDHVGGVGNGVHSSSNDHSSGGSGITSSSSASSGSLAYTNLMGTDKETSDFFMNEVSFVQLKMAVMDYLNSLKDRYSAQAEDTSALNNLPKQKLLSTALSGSLTKSLCYINRLQKEKPQGIHLQSRILIFQLCHDIPTQYISIMNAIFSAEKMEVVLDSVVLSDADSSFLQQASHFTKGVYMKPLRQEGLLQYLMSIFIVNVQLRETCVNMPVQSSVDFRASCFETKQSIDRGFVCSVCLSIFSRSINSCSTCGERLINVTSQPKRR